MHTHIYTDLAYIPTYLPTYLHMARDAYIYIYTHTHAYIHRCTYAFLRLWCVWCVCVWVTSLVHGNTGSLPNCFPKPVEQPNACRGAEEV